MELIKVNLALTVLIIFHVQETIILNRERAGVSISFCISIILLLGRRSLSRKFLYTCLSGNRTLPFSSTILN